MTARHHNNPIRHHSVYRGNPPHHCGLGLQTFPHQRVDTCPVTKGVSCSPFPSASPHSAPSSTVWCNLAPGPGLRTAFLSSDRCYHTPYNPPSTAQSSPSPPNKAPSSSFDPDIPRYDPDTRAFYCEPRAYADKFPDSWEANAFREGKYPDPTTFISGHLAPDCPKPQPSYAQAASKGSSKGKHNKSSLTAAKVPSANILAPEFPAPRSLPTAERRFYTPRSSPSEDPQAPLIAATFQDIAARVLRDANCALPLAVTTKVNDRGSVTLLVTDPATPAAAFAPYFDALSSQLNKSSPVGEAPGLPFRLAPNEAQLAIHSLTIAFLPEDPEDLFPCLAELILNSKNVRILAARYVNPNAHSREGKSATSVSVSVHPGDVPTMGSSIRLFSRS